MHVSDKKNIQILAKLVFIVFFRFYIDLVCTKKTSLTRGPYLGHPHNVDKRKIRPTAALDYSFSKAFSTQLIKNLAIDLYAK